MDSMAVIKSMFGKCLGVIAQLGPFTSTDFCPKGNCLLERFMTHLSRSLSLLLSCLLLLLLCPMLALTPPIDLLLFLHCLT